MIDISQGTGNLISAYGMKADQANLDAQRRRATGAALGGAAAGAVGAYAQYRAEEDHKAALQAYGESLGIPRDDAVWNDPKTAEAAITAKLDERKAKAAQDFQASQGDKNRALGAAQSGLVPGDARPAPPGMAPQGPAAAPAAPPATPAPQSGATGGSAAAPSSPSLFGAIGSGLSSAANAITSPFRGAAPAPAAPAAAPAPAPQGAAAVNAPAAPPAPAGGGYRFDPSADPATQRSLAEHKAQADYIASERQRVAKGTSALVAPQMRPFPGVMGTGANMPDVPVAPDRDTIRQRVAKDTTGQYDPTVTKAAEALLPDTTKTDVARINAEGKVAVAETNAGARTGAAKIQSDAAQAIHGLDPSSATYADDVRGILDRAEAEAKSKVDTRAGGLAVRERDATTREKVGGARVERSAALTDLGGKKFTAEEDDRLLKSADKELPQLRKRAASITNPEDAKAAKARLDELVPMIDAARKRQEDRAKAPFGDKGAAPPKTPDAPAQADAEPTPEEQAKIDGSPEHKAYWDAHPEEHASILEEMRAGK